MIMRIVTWKCNMALHRKLEALLSLDPDIAILQECADWATLSAKSPQIPCTDHDWIGYNHNKGLMVLSFGDFKMRRHSQYSSNFQLFLPVEFYQPFHLGLLAVWAFNDRVAAPNANASGFPRAALRWYREFLHSTACIVAGDFNNSVVWDTFGKESNFASIVEDIAQVGLVSAYHAERGFEFGQEPEPTLFWRKSLTEVYHIDYCFVPEQWMPKVRSVSVGDPEFWLNYSDHVPLCVDLDLANQ